MHVCDSAFLSATGSLNIIGIFEGIFTPGLPAIHPKMTVVANVEGQVGQHDFEILMKDPSSVKLISIKGKFNLNSLKRRFGIISDFNNINLTSQGKYRIELLVDSKLLGEVNFDVKVGTVR